MASVIDGIKVAALNSVKYCIVSIAAISGMIIALFIAGSIDNFSGMSVFGQALVVVRMLCATTFLFLWWLTVPLQIEILFKRMKKERNNDHD